MTELSFKSTEELTVPKEIINQVVGQENAVAIMKKAAHQRRHVLLIGDPGTGKCVGKDSAIQLSDGRVLTAEELAQHISEGNRPYALAVNPDLSLAHSKILRAEKTKAPAVTFKTNAGKTITVSTEHPFLTINKQGIFWKHARELSERSFIATARRLGAPEEFQKLPSFPLHYTPTKNHSNVKHITLPELFTEDFAEWCGYFWSEGYIVRKRSLTFTNSEENLIQRFAAISKKLFDLETHIRYFQYKNAFVATVQSSTLVNALEQMGWGKKLPDILLQSPLPVLRSFLRAYFDGDGSATTRAFEVTTKNHFVALQLQSMLLRFGITSVLRRRMCRATNSLMQAKPYTTLLIYDSQNLARLTSIGFTIPRKMERLLQLQGKKAQSNIDKVPHVGKLIFELKEKLRLTSEDIGIGIHQFQRYLKCTRIPTHATIQKAVAIFSQRFVALKTIQPKILTDGNLDLAQLAGELGISKTVLAHKTGRSLIQINEALESHDQSVAACIQALIAQCTTEEIENKLIALHQIANADVVWERITRITEEGTQELYDFEAEGTHNFLANNIFVHNSMLGLALAEMLPNSALTDIIAFPNPNDENTPLIKEVPAGQGRTMMRRAQIAGSKLLKNQNIIVLLLVIASTILPYYFWRSGSISDIVYAASMIASILFIVGFLMFLNLGARTLGSRLEVPKLVVDNSDKKIAPFFDATGAHAGALLGDVLHDPFQTFFPLLKITKLKDGKIHPVQLNEELDPLFTKYKGAAQINSQNYYEAIHFPKDELIVLGETNGSVSPVEVLSSNRYVYRGELIKLTTSENRELIVTPEHKIALWKKSKLSYIEARDIKEGDEVVAHTENIIIDEQDIINTYDAHQQEQCALYAQYLDIKAKNPTWGYKRIAKAMNQPSGKTRWWHAKRHIPVPMQTARWLKEKGLLPLKTDNPKLPLIAKVLGATFGDGGIFDNLNGIFLSSAEREAVQEFGTDIEKMFLLKPEENSRIIEGGEKGHSWCYQNTNRNIIRLFCALGAPRGNKTKIELHVPGWVKLNDTLESEFYGSFLGGELGTPIIHKHGNFLTSLEVGITGTPEFKNNRLSFLSALSCYLVKNSVATTSIYEGKYKTEGSVIFRLLIEKKFDNVLLFLMNIKINYCRYKIKRLYEAVGKWAMLKKSKYHELMSRGYGAEHAMRILNLTPNSLYLLLNHFGPRDPTSKLVPEIEEKINLDRVSEKKVEALGEIKA